MWEFWRGLCDFGVLLKMGCLTGNAGVEVAVGSTRSDSMGSVNGSCYCYQIVFTVAALTGKGSFI